MKIVNKIILCSILILTVVSCSEDDTINENGLGSITGTVVKNGDEIVVNTILNKLSNVVSIKGSIGVAGDYEFVNGEHLLDLLWDVLCLLIYLKLVVNGIKII